MTNYWINLGKDGTFASSGSISSTPDDVTQLFGDGLRESTRLVLYFHGGLVSETSGLASAERMNANYGAHAASVGVIWETGLSETIRENLLGITDTKLFKKALSWILAKAGVGVGDGARGPIGEYNAVEIEAMLETPEGAALLDSALPTQFDVAGAVATGKRGGLDDLDAETIAKELEYDLAADSSLPELIEKAHPDHPLRRKVDPGEGGRGARGLTVTSVALFIAKVIIAVLTRYRAKTAHDALPTAVEELLRAAYLADIGKFAWDAMKSKAQRMWIDDGSAPNLDSHGGGFILRQLEALQASRPDMIIDVVGHSAGAIAICEMLAAIEASKHRILLNNVVFLAPAVRFDLFARWIPRGPQIFKHFCMFTMTDEAEKSDRIAGKLYPRSLLYLVSGCFEDQPDAAILGMDRFLSLAGTSAGLDFDDVRNWLGKENRLVYSPSIASAGEGVRTGALAHGDFDNDAATLESLLFLARM